MDTASKQSLAGEGGGSTTTTNTPPPKTAPTGQGTVLGDTRSPLGKETTHTARDTPHPGFDPSALPAPRSTAPADVRVAKSAEPAPDRVSARVPVQTPVAPVPHPHSFHGPVVTPLSMTNSVLPPLTLNQVAILAAAQNKLPNDRLNSFVRRMGRHTQASAGKRSRFYKGDNYVDNVSYSWRNMDLFADYQKQMYTPFGSVKTSCKK